MGRSSAKGGGSSGDIRYVSGSFTATAEQETITHEIGEVPDIIIVATTNVPEANKIFYAIGFSQAMIDKLGGGYLNKVSFLFASGGAGSGTGNQGIEYSAEGTYYEQYGGIRNFTSTTFEMGGTEYGLDTGYTYTAICGIV